MIRTCDSRWSAVRSSVQPDSRQAGEEAARQALTAADAKLIIVVRSDNHDAKAVLAGINAISGGIPLVGATTSGEIVNGWAGDDAVVVTAMGGAGIDASASIATGVTGRQRQAGIEIAGCIDAITSYEHRVLVILADGLAEGHLDMLRGAYSILGAAVPFVGGCAGDAMRMRQTRQLYGTDVFTGAVVAAGIGSVAPLGIGVRHGWHQIGNPMIVTRTVGNSVLTINDEPALDWYLRCLEAPDDAYHDQAAFVAFAGVHPLGLSHRSGGHEMRYIVRADFDERALVLIADVPYGTLIWLSQGDTETILDATEDACRSAIEALGQREPLGLIAFDCASRKQALGADGTDREVRRITEQARGAPVAGFYTYGEIARTKGINGYHNQTLVVLAMS